MSPGRSTRCSAQNALYGTGSGSGDGTHPNAGKTGTTEDHADAWFVGYTRDLSTAVWMGYPKRRDPDALRPRTSGRRRDLPGADLAPLHGGRGVAQAGAPVPDAEARCPSYRPFEQRLLRLRRPYYTPTYAATTDDHGSTPTTTADSAKLTPRRRRRHRTSKPTSRPAPPRHPARPAAASDRVDGPADAAAAGAAAVTTTPPIRRAWLRRDDLLTIDEALALVLERVTPLEAEDVPLATAAAACPPSRAHAAVDLPPFPASAMDGFALRAADAPGTLPVVARVAAGRPAPRALEPGEAMAIATGGVVPDGADSVVPIEDVEERDGRWSSIGHRCRGDNVRDARRRSPRRRPGRRGRRAARPRPPRRARRRRRDRRPLRAASRASSWSSPGPSSRAPGEPLEPGEIYDANGFILATQIRERRRGRSSGCRRCRTTRDATRAAIARGLEADVLVTTGGVSVGVHDLVRAAEAELGVEEIFWRVAVRPGKPIAFGVRGRTLVFGLPGNPVSSLVGFELFVRPALLALQGLADPRPRVPARPPRRARRAASRPATRSCARARASRADAVVLDPLTGQESHMIARAATADALVLVPQGEGELEAGSAGQLPAL